VEEKYLRVANYVRNMNTEIDMIAHSCGCRHARELKREHVRIVQSANHSIALNMLSPYPVIGVKPTPRPIDTLGPVAAVPAKETREAEAPR
jgi:hypothetical protein